jgi:SAM-dependent methyltransferase
MTGEKDTDETLRASDLDAATEELKLTPPPKPRRDSVGVATGEPVSGSIPAAPRVPLIPSDQQPAPRSGEGAYGRSDPPRPRAAVSDPPRPRERAPSFPLPPAPVSLENAIPLISRSNRPSAQTPAASPLRSEPSPVVGVSSAGSARARSPSFPPPAVEVAQQPAAPAAAPPQTLEIAPPPPAAGNSPAPYDSGYGSSEPQPPEPPKPSVAILAMKIIAVGAPTVSDPPEVGPDIEQDIEIHVDLPNALASGLEEPADANFDDDTPPYVERLTPEPVELSDADVAPDSTQTPMRAEVAAPEVTAREETISIPPIEIDADTPVPEISPTGDEAPPDIPGEGEAGKQPPPPPRRKTASKSTPPGKTLPTAKKRQRRPWWEDVFGEEFIRAAPKVSPSHVAREVDFIESSLGIAPGGVVLDLACGAGHHAVELAARGYGMVGYDLSLYQLSLAADVAKARAQKINFMQGDMREMAFEDMFDGVFSWNTSFGYFEEEKNLSVLQRVFRALKPGGMFLVDVVNRDFAASQSPSQNWYEGEGCVCMDDMSLDFITSRLRVKRSVILDDGRTRECTYSVRVYSLHELGKLLHDVGFRVTECTGHPSVPGVFFGEHSPRIIVVAQKP